MLYNKEELRQQVMIALLHNPQSWMPVYDDPKTMCGIIEVPVPEKGDTAGITSIAMDVFVHNLNIITNKVVDKFS